MTKTPRVHTHFFVCTNRRPDGHPLPSCGQRGGQEVFAAFAEELAQRGYPSDGKVTATGCLTPCQYGPNLVVYPEGIWYADLTPGDADEILAAHLDRGETVDRLRLPPEVRVS